MLTKVAKPKDAYTASAVALAPARDLSIEAYREFLKAKASVSQDYGFAIDRSEVNPICKPHQVDSVVWMVRGGRRALFSSFGLGKTFCQIEACRLTLEHAGGRALIVAPLGVRQEFKRDAAKLGLEITFVRSMDDVRQRELFDGNSNIYITNYETVREGKLDPANFTVTSLDEAAVLRSFGGTKTFREFMRLFESLPYRFVATATPDPNEFIELLAYAAYLGISDVSGAKTRFFKRDSTKADKLTIHPHKEEEFWLWVASWGLFLNAPSDLGHPNDGYDLPPLEVVYHEIPTLHIGGSFERDGQQRMFRDAQMGVVDAAREKRDTLDRRVEKMREIIQGGISVTRRPTEEIGVSQSVLRQEQGAPVSNAKRERCPATGGNQGISESLSREEQEAAFGRAESADGEALSGEQGALQRKEQTVARGESGKIQRDTEGERNQSQEQVAEIRPDSRGVRELVGQTGWPLSDLPETDATTGSGPRSPNWSSQGAALSDMQCGPGSVSGEPGNPCAGNRVPSQFIVWCDLNDEQRAVDRALDQLGISYSSLYGAMSLEEREVELEQWRRCETTAFVSKPVMYGAGINLQQCNTAIFLGIGFKFSEFLQAIKRIHRFLQGKPVKIHLIYAESERGVLENLKRKWEQHKRKVEKMAEIIREFGLSQQAMIVAMQRSMGVERVEVLGDNYRLINNDCVEEAQLMADSSVGLILTSIPFSTQYEYTPSMNDFGHTESNRHFFEQMDFLTPHLFRVLQPGRIAAIHVKDRIVPGGMTGLGFQTVYPFHVDCIAHYTRHGFAYMGMKTIVTDVVRENNQTYRLGWTEQCKDGTKMGVGMPEYLLLFRKPPTDTTNSYADVPVVKSKGGVFFACPECGFKTLDERQFLAFSDATSDKECPSCKAHITVNIHRVNGYSRSRWQIDAHGFARSSGNRPPRPEELEALQHQQIFKIFRDYSLNHVYDFEYHVRIGEALERKQRLPVTFMLLQPASWNPEVWTDITRMRTLNGAQSAKGKQMHLCPMQLDLAERAITQWSMEGETVLDPFGGLMTVPMMAVKLGRKGIGIELNPNYFADGCLYVEAASREVAMPTLFDIVEAEAEELPLAVVGD